MKDLDSRNREPTASPTTCPTDVPPALRELSAAERQLVSGGVLSHFAPTIPWPGH
jgi:hypothetical protein